ncbi:MAG: ABC transporter permease [Anaerolineae bacterium]|nr:ABC transporter permease [Anaerolineae bacterium]
MAVFLAFKEVWRNRGRFFLFSLVIALITLLVLFIAALAEGLANANKEFLVKLDAQLLVLQKNVDLSTSASRLDRSLLNNIRRIEGVEDVGTLGFSSAKVLIGNSNKTLDVAVVGIEPGRPGSPPILQGSPLLSNSTREAVIDAKVAQETGLKPGDELMLRTIKGTEEKIFTLRVIGLTDSREYLYQPTVFLPFVTWDIIRAQADMGERSMMTFITNVIAVRLTDPTQAAFVAQRILKDVKNVEVTTIKAAYEASPGYSAQQNTLNTQRGFTLLIGILVIGGFFQIQMLQKIPQIGVLKAIGVSNATVAGAVVMQIVLVTTFGVVLGSVVTLLAALVLPATVPIVFNGTSVLYAIISLLLIGPAGGLVTVRLAVRVEPLIALGLSS